MSEMSLYQITNEFVALMQNDELTEEEQVKMGEELEVLLLQKSSNIIAYTRNVEGFIDIAKQEVERIRQLIKTAEGKLGRFKGYVKDNMERLGINSVPTEIGTLSIAKNPMSVEILDETKIPEQFKKTVTVVEIDKNAIKEHFKETGELIEGVKIHTNKTNLRIK